MPLTDCSGRNHNACFEAPFCSLTNYQVSDPTKGFSRYFECHHGFFKKHASFRACCFGTAVFLKNWLIMVDSVITNRMQNRAKCYISTKI